MVTETMITIEEEKINTFSQRSYDSLLNTIELHRLVCSCGRHGSFTFYGSYIRTVKTNGSRIPLRISRVRCTESGRTHALLPSSIVPYSHIPVARQAAIIRCFESSSGMEPVLDAAVDESNVRSVFRSYRKYWRERLRYEGIRISPVRELIRRAFHAFRRQFMQIRRTANLLFLRPT